MEYAVFSVFVMVAAVDVVLVSRFLGVGRFRRRLLMIIQIITNMKMTMMTGTDTPTPIDTLDADAE